MIPIDSQDGKQSNGIQFDFFQWNFRVVIEIFIQMNENCTNIYILKLKINSLHANETNGGLYGLNSFICWMWATRKHLTSLVRHADVSLVKNEVTCSEKEIIIFSNEICQFIQTAF